METTKSKTLEVNGIHYDASTGVKIGAAQSSTTKTGKNIDGFFRSRTSGSLRPTVAQVKAAQAAKARRQANHLKHHAPQASHSVPVRSAAATPKKLQAVTVHRRQTGENHLQHHTSQASATLMRKAVKRPAPSFHKQAKTKAALTHAVPSLIAVKPSVASVDIGRLTRAKQTSRSPLVSHHTAPASKLAPQFVPLAVKPVPGKPGADTPSAAPAPTPTNKPTPTDIFEHALANASHYVDVKHHSRAFKQKTRNHVLSMAAGTLALVIIAGFAAYQNTPGLQFKVASMQAGVTTQMPNLKAAGFAYKGVKSSDGKLTVGFSGQNGSYQMTQQSTNWTNDDMIEHIGATNASGQPVYKAIDAGNTKVYRFTNTDATWVENGVWYSVSGTTGLTDQQVAKLAQNI
jgi:hypothetical protein